MIKALASMTLPAVPVEILRARCATCSMHQLCLSMGLDMGNMDKLDRIIGRRRKAKKRFAADMSRFTSSACRCLPM